MAIQWKARWGAIFLLLPLAGGGAWAAAAASPPTAGAVTRPTTHSSPALPAALRPALYKALAKDAGAAYGIKKNGCAVLAQQKLTACFNAHGAHFTGATPVSLHLVAFGRSGALTSVKPVRPAFHGNRVNYEHGNLITWWQVLPIGFEQGFTIAKRPAGHGELTLALATTRHSRESGNPVGESIPANGRDTNSHRVSASAGMTKKENGDTLAWGKLRYGDLVVTDADGNVVPAKLTSKDGRILIAVNDTHAAYPLTVDPLVWLEQQVNASNYGSGDVFGTTVAISGTTAFIAAPDAPQQPNVNGPGAVYVFDESGGIWTQSQELTASDGMVNYQFGDSLAISGTTALVGAPNAYSDPGGGAVYVFTESGGTWTQTAKLVSSDSDPFDEEFGESVALDGTTALVGAPQSDTGQAFVFTESGGTWTQTAELTASNGGLDPFLGESVALDGTTAFVTAPFATVNGNSNQGAVYVFNESGGTWTQTAELTASDGEAGDEFGSSMALDGATALVSGNFNGFYGGGVYVFTESGGTWTQTAELTAPGGLFLFGRSLALDGTTALINGSDVNQSVVYVFTESGGTWTQTAELAASGAAAKASFGSSVALDDATKLVGAHYAAVHGENGAGVAYFISAPGDLNFALSAPETATPNVPYVSQAIVTNAATTASPAVALTVAVPAAVSFVGATASQGSCNEASGVVTCNFGPINANAGMATANVTLKPNTVGTIENTASVESSPVLTAGAPTVVTGSCPDGYAEYDGHLDAGGTFTSSPIAVAEAGQKYVGLISPASFSFFAIVSTSYGTHTYIYPHVKQGHRWGAAGSYRVGVQAGPDAGGDYTLCVNLNPAQ